MNGLHHDVIFYRTENPLFGYLQPFFVEYRTENPLFMNKSTINAFFGKITDSGSYISIKMGYFSQIAELESYKSLLIWKNQQQTIL